MSQIVPSAQATLKTQHSQLDSASLDEHWKNLLCGGSRELRKKSDKLVSVLWVKSPGYSDVTEDKKHEWPNWSLPVILILKVKHKSEDVQSCPTLCDPVDWSPSGSSIHFPGQNTVVGSHFLLQGNFPIQGSNPDLLHCTWNLWHLSHRECLIKIRTTVNRKISTTASLTTLNPWTVYITTNWGKLLERWECQTTILPPEKPVCRSRSNS